MAIDGIREDIDRVVYLGGRTVEVRVDKVQALCDLADQAKRIESLLDALVFPLREEWPLTSKAVEQHRDDLGEILARLEDKE